MKINIFGSTGIIGSKTLDIINNYFPSIKINLLCSNTNVRKLIKQIEIYSPKYVYLNDFKKIDFLKKNINKNISILNFNELKSYLINSKSDLCELKGSSFTTSISGSKSAIARIVVDFPVLRSPIIITPPILGPITFNCKASFISS